MASVIKILGQEQTFTVANTFSADGSTAIAGLNAVRVINISNTTAAVITINSSPVANLTLMPSGEVIVKKYANTAMTASSANLLAVAIAYENN